MEQKNIDLKQISIIELKAVAFDVLTQINYLQQQMNVVNNELNERSKPTPTVEG